MTQVTDFQELVNYGYAYNWPNKKLAVTRGKSNSDIVVLYATDNRNKSAGVGFIPHTCGGAAGRSNF